MHATCLYLASASPRRLELLRQAGYAPVTVPTDLDESLHEASTPAGLVLALAEAKARRAAERSVPPGSYGVILAADTAVVIDGVVLGKPADAGDARAMLERLSGRTHEVVTGFFLLRTDDDLTHGEVCTTHVSFRELDEETIGEYLATGEAMDKAGAYGIQGRAGSFARQVDGSWSNVVGLPVERLPAAFARIGIDHTLLLATTRE